MRSEVIERVACLIHVFRRNLQWLNTEVLGSASSIGVVGEPDFSKSARVVRGYIQKSIEHDLFVRQLLEIFDIDLVGSVAAVIF